MKKPESIDDLLTYNLHDRNHYVLRHIGRLVQISDINQNEEQKTLLLLNSIENLLALGKINAAKQTLISLNHIKNSDSTLLKALYYHIEGLFFLYESHIIESLEAFDKSMTLSKLIKDNNLYRRTRLYKEMALIEFYEPEALNHLSNYLHTYHDLTSYEKSMMAAVYLIGINHFQKRLSEEELLFIDQCVNPEDVGPFAFYLIAKQSYNQNQDTSLHAKISSLLLKTQGIKGPFWIINDYINEVYPDILSDDLLLKWQNTFLLPLIQYRKKDQSSLFSHIEDNPKVSLTSCLNCDNRCCYDGVYVTYAEEDKIKSHIRQYPEEFTHLPQEFLEDGEWEFLFGGKRTKRVPHVYTRSDYPAHFEKTICIFALKDGSCSLQKSAIRHDMHPWSLKPELCWKFPLIGLFNDDGYNHPHYFGQKDPHYFDENQPGYLSFLPCSVVTEEGISWKKMYRNELQYYLANEEKKKK